MSAYRVTLLGNGLVRVFDRRSQLSGLYTLDGVYHGGDLTGAAWVVRSWVNS